MPVTVKFQSVTLEIQPWKHPSGRDYFRAIYHTAAGKRMFLTRSTLAKAKDAAFKKAVELAKGTIDFNALNHPQLTAIRRMLDADPSLALVDEFLLWKSKVKPEKPANVAVSEFLAVKKTNEGLSTQNGKTLKKHLSPFVAMFGKTPLASITVPQLEAFLISKPWKNRTRKNIRASVVTFFRWCRTCEYLPDEKTAAEKMGTPIVGDAIPQTYAPTEMRLMLEAVKPEYLPWLATGAFAGCRTDEIAPIAGSNKSPLDWSDFRWDQGIIIIRPQTAKMRRRRVIPIHPVLRAWLWPVRRESGRILDAPPPTKLGRGKGAEAETVRLGKLVGGWRSNALRDSYISYRAAKVGLGITSMEAGNSEEEAKASYNDAKSEAEADEWFALMPLGAVSGGATTDSVSECSQVLGNQR